METARKVCGVMKEKKKKIKLLSCSFRRLGMCFRNNVRESAFKFLQFTTYNIISRYFPPHKEMMLFPFSFNFISLLLIKLCVRMAPIWFVLLLHCCLLIDFLAAALRNRWGSISLQNWGPFFPLRSNWPWRSFLSSSLPNDFNFFLLSCGFLYKGISHAL